MRTMITSFTAWAGLRKTDNEALRVVDTALTVVATLLVTVTYALLRP